MPESNLYGPYPLTDTAIDANVAHGIGAYALGYNSADGQSFWIRYVGRSDSDLNKRLKDHVGKYKLFKYGHLPTVKAAFEKECTLYHDFSPPDNDVHPARPAGTQYRCPVQTCPV